jgi:[protein-PII] uridylyltransferase
VSLRAALDALFATFVPPLAAGGAACRAISDLYDAEIRARFDEAKAGIAAPLALVATGGWARRELAPYSDIDFIVLHERDEASAKQLADKLLYPLWDEKLAIGHAIREARATARLAREDLATATALLDARHIAGDRRLTTDLMRATLGALAPGGNPNDFIAMLAAEQKGRHERFGASLYLLEPNLKQGIGALRDLSTALWAAQVRWHPPRPGEDPEPTEGLIANLVSMGHLTRRQGDVLANARDFMLRIRTLVQLTAKRRFDQLTFEIQEALGPKLYPNAKPHEGDIRSAVAPAVEALMRDYYLHAREVVQVTDHLLDSARVPARRKPRIAPVDGSFITWNGELAIKDPKLFADRPSEMVRLFRVAVREQLPIYGHTRELIAETVARDPEALARDPLAGRLLLDALVDIRDSAQPSALEVMHQLGIVSAIIPEWRPCTARVQHDLYHVYTVDQHQLYAVQMQKRIARGELVQEHPLATDLWKEVKRPASLLLGTMLHDVGKPLGKGHAEKGAVVTRSVAARLGMSDADGELAEFLVRQHLTMSHLSQRRDLSDPEVIARFGERVGDDEHLVQLYLVTLCDTAMTAPDNLNAWKDGLLRDLLLRTREHFRAGSPEAATQAEAAAREKAIQIATDGMSADAARTAVDGIDPRLFAQLTPRQAARQVKLASAAQHKQPTVAIEVHCYPMKGHSELAIVAPDAPGVLAVIAGALTASRVDVLGAVLGHIDFSDHRLVLDTFYVRDLKGEAIADDDPRWARLLGDLRELLAGEPDPTAVASLIAKRRPRSALPPRVTPGVPTEIRLHDDSTQATIVEVFTRDRVGVLYAITQTLADLGLDISLAKVSTEGEKVADVFYVTRAGKRLTDKALREVLVERLRMAVQAPGLTGS